ncbi:bifunctional diguanylate cyclase/phosphodiesterase [Dasania marina]|mgnify:CR=1 FL=1|uniref:GGDEF domain-containing protein n=1 Tax=Dasania marina TaxID=471499 RepID=UPI0030D73028|tara:strand:+ start:44531 stop:46300 length:1770 start_codon:yes stop_codon:yes gene_type:complete
MSPIAYTDELLQIIKHNLLTAVFQPIVNLRQAKLHGYEALTRGPANSPLHNPLQLFDTASKSGNLSKLEFACRDAACKRFSQYEADGKLFINVSPISLAEAGYEHGMTDWILSQYSIPAKNIVIELSEQYPLDDYDLLKRSFDHFRDKGFQVAIDDLGAGYAGLKAWSELRPDYVKIDRHFIENINEDPVKREFVRSIQEIAKELDCKVIAEGIETAEELAVVHALKIQFGQGYYLGRPKAIPANFHSIQDKLLSINNHQSIICLSQTVADLSLSYPAIHKNWSLNRVIDLFHSNKGLRCLPVTEGDSPLGLIERQAVLELMTGRYSRELYGHKSVLSFMSKQAVIVDLNTSLEEVSRKLTTSQSDNLQQDFIITNNSAYYGIGKTSTLLQKITEQQIRYARYANPLSQLPGNVPIYEHVDKLLQQQSPFTIAYFDLNNFKAFNDYYGYNMGDQVLQLLSDILKKMLISADDFIGHIGGDDFIATFERSDWLQQCEIIKRDFEQQVKRFYSPEVLEKQGLWQIDRQGKKQFFGLLTLAIGLAQPDIHDCKSHHDVAALAGEAKKQAKRSDNGIFISRRRRPQGEACVPL